MSFIVPFIPYIAAAVSVAGTAMQMNAQRRMAASQSDYTQRTAEYYAAGKETEATQYEEQSLEEFAAAQRVAEEEKRRSRILQSRAIAVAGASGAGVSDPTVVDIVSDLSGEGAYRAAVATYEGSERAQTKQRAADAARYEGATGLQSGSFSAASQRQAGRYAEVGTIFQGAGNLLSMYGKYGLPSTTTSR